MNFINYIYIVNSFFFISMAIWLKDHQQFYFIMFCHLVLSSIFIVWHVILYKKALQNNKVESQIEEMKKELKNIKISVRNIASVVSSVKFDDKISNILENFPTK